ncbi:DUF3007 domain-containing protein [filamentous cyanobacterium CCP5]|nr:DUF3007 domain-containing protein [filamentous cyanobacterium CCP5]
MRRIDILGIGLGLFLVGGSIYLAFRVFGLDDLSAGIWSQVVLVGIVVVWLVSYLVRATTQSMTYNQQLKDYEEAVLQKRLDELSPEELEALQGQLEAEGSEAPPSSPEA